MQHKVNEWKLVSVRARLVRTKPYNTPISAVRYWRTQVQHSASFNEGCESLTVLMLNSRMHIMGHQVVSIGTVDSVLAHAREVFRTAIVANASAIVIVHNHPSGETSPSFADERMTKELVAAGKIIGINVFDHLIVGHNNFTSMREAQVVPCPT